MLKNFLDLNLGAAFFALGDLLKLLGGGVHGDDLVARHGRMHVLRVHAIELLLLFGAGLLLIFRY